MSKLKTETQLPQTIVSSRISTLSLGAKHKLFAIWVSKERLEGSKTLDLMFELDDIYLEKYNENRIKEGFTASKLLAYEYLLSLVYTPEEIVRLLLCEKDKIEQFKKK